MSLGSVIVTGAGSGLGAAIADSIAKAGGNPIVFDVKPNGSRYESHTVDVSDRAAVQQAVSQVASDHDDFAAVVANAGIDACGPFGDVAGDAWDRVIGVNLMGTANLVRSALPTLMERKGRVVTVASTLGLRAVSDATAYCASKFGVVGFTRALATELTGKVGVTLLIPGGMQTAFFDGRDPKYQPGADAKLNAPANVASMVVVALSQPAGCELRELLIVPSYESSWP